ncbi:hypothetical protein MRX96_002961 [Rhipicephalus microplus]
MKQKSLEAAWNKGVISGNHMQGSPSCNELKVVGFQVHGREVTANIIKFYALTRLHFLAKASNKSRNLQRQKQKLLKMRRCQ